MEHQGHQQVESHKQHQPIPLLKPPPPELFQSTSAATTKSDLQPNLWNGNDLYNVLHGPMESSDDYIARLEGKLSKGMKVSPPKLAKRLQDERESKIFNGEIPDDDNGESDPDDGDESVNEGCAILLSNVKPMNNEGETFSNEEVDETSQPFLSKEERESYLNENDEIENNINNNSKSDNSNNSEGGSDNNDDDECKCKLCIIL